MFRIVKFQLLARIVAVCTASISTLVYAVMQEWVDKNYSLFNIIAVAVTASSLLALILSFSITARFILWIYSFFDKTAFPDLSGTWSGTVSYDGGTMQIRAVIRQTIDQTQIDIHGSTMKSSTLEATPVIESGQKKLYYVYHCTPRNPSYSSYHGSTILNIRRPLANGNVGLALSGRYFTDRKTVGTIELNLDGKDLGKDVSFY